MKIMVKTLFEIKIHSAYGVQKDALFDYIFFGHITVIINSLIPSWNSTRDVIF